MKVLVVEDDSTLLEAVVYNLKRQGYEVVSASDGASAVDTARSDKPDIIILDIMLPELDGLEVCRILRREMATPIIMLTARTDEIDKVVGLEMGADDYITKPFSMRELMARVKAMNRRTQLIREEIGSQASDNLAEDKPKNGQPSLIFDNLEIDLERHEVRLDGKPLHLRPKEYELLVFLARHRGVALSRDLILERLWGWTYDGNSRTVDVHVRWLREKIEPDPTDPDRIVTVRGIGYRFEG